MDYIRYNNLNVFKTKQKGNKVKKSTKHKVKKPTKS